MLGLAIGFMSLIFALFEAGFVGYRMDKPHKPFSAQRFLLLVVIFHFLNMVVVGLLSHWCDLKWFS